MAQNLSNFSLNRFNNPNAQFDIGNWVAFADAANTSPVDGTGGSPSVTITRTESSALDGNASLLFTKDAVNRQGEGASADIAIQASDQTKVLTFKCDYQITTGTYSEGSSTAQSDLTWWVYDITNAVIYQATPSNIGGAVSTTNQYNGQFQWQVPSGCLKARLIMFIPTTSASAFTVRFNNVSFGREPINVGSIHTPWTSYTPTISATGTNSNVSAYYRRDADTLWVRGSWTLGTVGASEFRWSLPSGLVAASGFTTHVSGYITHGITTSNIYTVLAQPNQTYVNVGRINTASIGITPMFGNVFTGAFDNNIWFQVQVAGWAANGTLGQDADTRVCAAKYVQGTSYVFPKSLPFQFNTLNYDTHAAATYGAGVTFTYYVPVAGIYQYALGLLSDNVQNVGAANDVYNVCALKNGTTFAGGFMGALRTAAAATYLIEGQVSGSGQFVAGDAIAFMNTTGGASYLAQANTQFNYMTINRLSGPAQVQAADIPKASYNTNAAQSISNASTAIVDFEDKIYDTFSLVTTGTWKFTCPRAGVVRVHAMITYASAVFTLNNTVKLELYKNGSLYKGLCYSTIEATITDPITVDGMAEVSVIAGDYLDVRTAHGEATARSLTSTNTQNYIDVSFIDGLS